MLALEQRPFSWEDICGQKMLVAEMKKRSLTRDFPTVMFFAGNSGTGKTTVASIIAALINDNNPIKGEGCLNPNPDSPESKAILNETFNMSCSMYDASKMGKEDVLKLEETASSESFFGGKRILIIDEAQALSQHAKGVTLKLLEKKRASTHIILCTMNPESFDVSIKSRGVFYLFRSPSSSEIAECLFNIIQKLNIEVPDIFVKEGIFSIAENCEGSVRLAVQALDRSLVGEIYSAEAIQKAFGFVSNMKLFEIVSEMAKKDPSVFQEINKMDIKEFFNLSYQFIADCLVYHRTSVVSAPWKIGVYDRLKRYSGEIAELFDLYSDIEQTMGGYFRNTYCLAKLTDFFTMHPILAPQGVTAVRQAVSAPAIRYPVKKV